MQATSLQPGQWSVVGRPARWDLGLREPSRSPWSSLTSRLASNLAKGHHHRALDLFLATSEHGPRVRQQEQVDVHLPLLLFSTSPHLSAWLQHPLSQPHLLSANQQTTHLLAAARRQTLVPPSFCLFAPGARTGKRMPPRSGC